MYLNGPNNRVIGGLGQAANLSLKQRLAYLSIVKCRRLAGFI